MIYNQFNNEQSLATKWLYSKVTTLLNKINITIYFKLNISHVTIAIKPGPHINLIYEPGM